MDHNYFMQQCLNLAALGSGKVAPNPMVGSVVVHNGIIIGEGYHEVYGGPHAEVNAINSVKDKSLLAESTIYVNLEPCAHFGKTPPCSDLIIANKIPNVVIGAVDDHELVAGKGIKKLRESGANVTTNVLQEKCLALNKRFYTFHNKKRPFIFLKWAETKDGFISRLNLNQVSPEDNWISGPESKLFVHQMRAEEQAILIGKTTAITDNPALTTRLTEGKSPLRVIVSNTTEGLNDLQIVTDDHPTLIFNRESTKTENNKEWIQFNGEIKSVLKELKNRNIQSIIIEGGTSILNQFIEQDLWDEAFQITGNKTFNEGIKAPDFANNLRSHQIKLGEDLINHYKK